MKSGFEIGFIDISRLWMLLNTYYTKLIATVGVAVGNDKDSK
jgi:hypothetical protein